jgi:hypothetical protein
MAQSTVDECRGSDGATCVVQIEEYYVESCSGRSARGRCRGRDITTGYGELEAPAVLNKDQTHSEIESQR